MTNFVSVVKKARLTGEFTLILHQTVEGVVVTKVTSREVDDEILCSLGDGFVLSQELMRLVSQYKDTTLGIMTDTHPILAKVLPIDLMQDSLEVSQKVKSTKKSNKVIFNLKSSGGSAGLDFDVVASFELEAVEG